MNPENKPKTVLIVDDEPQIRKLLKAHLSKNGFQVIEKQNGREALEHIEAIGCSGLDVIVSDIMMPELDGVALATWISLKCPNIPIVLMSGYARPESMDLQTAGHKWVFVPKPFMPKSVIDAIHTLLHL